MANRTHNIRTRGRVNAEVIGDAATDTGDGPILSRPIEPLLDIDTHRACFSLGFISLYVSAAFKLRRVPGRLRGVGSGAERAAAYAGKQAQRAP